MLQVSARGREAALAAHCSNRLHFFLPKAGTRCAQSQREVGGEESLLPADPTAPSPGELRGEEGNQGGHSPSSKKRTSCAVTLYFSGGINLFVLWGRNAATCPGSGISQSWISPGWEFTLTLLNLFFFAVAARALWRHACRDVALQPCCPVNSAGRAVPRFTPGWCKRPDPDRSGQGLCGLGRR